MRFEKLNDDKIRITLNREDLEKKDINLHDFMSSSIESQDLFFDMLNEAEKEIGFVTKNYQIRIEALAVASGDFIITVTRSLPSNNHKLLLQKKLKLEENKLLLILQMLYMLFLHLKSFASFVYFYNATKYHILTLQKI